MMIHPVLKEIALLFKDAGKEICLVGGAVRGLLLGMSIHDWDLATDAAPEEVTKIFRQAKQKASVIPTGIKHGTVTVIYKKQSMEITTYRTEADYSDGRRPDKVIYSASIEEDLSRRDFTMNAIALRLPKGEKIDPFNGTGDLKKGIIRCVGDPALRFGEDGLRPLRAVRFAAQLGFQVDSETLSAIPGTLANCAKVSAERVRDEIEKIIASKKPSRAFLLMEQTGLLKLFLPELAEGRGVHQNDYHEFDVLDHNLLACDYAAEKGFPADVRLAALLHDAGKVQTRKQASDDSNNFTFYNHEIESKNIARNILSRLRFPNQVIDMVCHLVKEHMFHYTDDWSDAAVRRFIVRIGEENITKFYQLRKADAYAKAGTEPPRDSLLPLARRVEKALAENHAFSLKDLAVKGSDLTSIGIKPGKTMGIILRELLESVLDDPAMNNHEDLLKLAEKFNEVTYLE